MKFARFLALALASLLTVTVFVPLLSQPAQAQFVSAYAQGVMLRGEWSPNQCNNERVKFNADGTGIRLINRAGWQSGYPFHYGFREGRLVIGEQPLSVPTDNIFVYDVSQSTLRAFTARELPNPAVRGQPENLSLRRCFDTVETRLDDEVLNRLAQASVLQEIGQTEQAACAVFSTIVYVGQPQEGGSFYRRVANEIIAHFSGNLELFAGSANVALGNCPEAAGYDLASQAVWSGLFADALWDVAAGGSLNAACARLGDGPSGRSWPARIVRGTTALLCRTDRQTARRPVDLDNDPVVRRSRAIGRVDASDANEAFRERWNIPASGYRPAYRPGTSVERFQTTQPETFYRLHGSDNPVGAFMFRREQIEGKSMEQISREFSIPMENLRNARVSEVNVPAGTTLQAGEVNPIPEFGGVDAGQVQYEIPLGRGQIPETWFNQVQNWQFGR